MSAFTHCNQTVLTVVLLVLGLLPAGQSWLNLVALPALAFETGYAVRLYMAEDRRETLARQREIAKTGTPLEESTMALLLILGSRR